MIIREIKNNPIETLKNFDWFNDYKDTRSWCVNQGLTEIVDQLDAGDKAYWQERNKKWLESQNKA